MRRKNTAVNRAFVFLLPLCCNCDYKCVHSTARKKSNWKIGPGSLDRSHFVLFLAVSAPYNFGFGDFPPINPTRYLRTPWTSKQECVSVVPG